MSRKQRWSWSLIVPLLVGFIIFAVGCTTNNTPTSRETLDPLTLVTQAANNIISANSFRLTIAQTGPDYHLATVQGVATFRQAEGQYVAPGQLQARVRVVVLGIPLDIDVFARGAEQWVRAIFTGNQWSNSFVFAEGFNPESLLAEDTGFNAALNALIDLNYIGIETLETGATVHHLSGVATGEGMNALLVGMIQAAGEVPIDVYIDTTTLQPVRFVLRLFEANPGSSSIGRVNPLDPAAALDASTGDPLTSVAESTPEVTAEADAEAGAETTAEPQTEPYVWILDIYDINAPAELDPPPESAPDVGTGLDLSEATAEATSEATPEAGA